MTGLFARHRGLTAAAGALALGYGWKGAMAVYLPGGMDAAIGFDKTGLYVMYVLNDFGSFIGWLGVTVAAGAIAWMAFRERTVSAGSAPSASCRWSRSSRSSAAPASRASRASSARSGW